MSPRHRHYLLLEQGIGSGVFNVVLNAAIAWALFHGMDAVPLWGQQSIAGDTIGTAFMLPLLTTLIASRVVYGHVRRRRVPAWAPSDGSVLQRLPGGLFRRGTVLGIACLAAVGVPATGALDAAGVAEMSFGGFILFKALFAGALAAVVTPVIARLALADASEPG